jgi:site-specific DNA recombinase
MTKAVALYARVSSQRQVQQATIDSQLAALRARASTDGCVVLPNDEYVDNGHSGSSLRRPSLERLRDRVAQGALDVVYIHSPDRLARRHAHQVLLLLRRRRSSNAIARSQNATRGTGATYSRA